MRTLSTARSFLFVPGSEEHRIRKAFDSDADVVVVDLEDAVASSEKEVARGLTASILPGIESASLRAIRVNGGDSPYFQDDLALVSDLPVDAIVLPKATPETVGAMGAPRARLVAIVETAQGLRRSFDTVSDARVEALMLGAVDLGLELGLEPRKDGQELLFARSQLVVDSAAAGRRAPIDQVWTNVRDTSGLEADCRLARSLGFRGKACIHPAQVEVVNTAFSPTEDELERALRIVAAYERAAADGRGAVALDGEMIDLPVVERARAVLADAERSPSHVD